MDTTWATIIGAIIVGVIAVIPGTLSGYASIKSVNNTAKIAQKAVDVSQQTLTQTEAIHVAVNSNLAALKQELADSNKQIVELKNIIKGMTDKMFESETNSTEQRLKNLEKRK